MLHKLTLDDNVWQKILFKIESNEERIMQRTETWSFISPPSVPILPQKGLFLEQAIFDILMHNNLVHHRVAFE